MFAVMETGGKQYKVAEGDVLFIEKLGVEAGETVTFDKVLAVCGESVNVGAPYVTDRTTPLSKSTRSTRNDDHNHLYEIR